MTASSFRKGRGLKPLLLAVALSAGLHTGATLAQAAAPAPQTIDIPAGSLAQALDRLGEQTGALITYEPGLVQGLNAPRVSGQLSTSEVLRRLLRSEEHTSELQSLMRISYAVFCLKKTKQAHTSDSIYKSKYNKNTLK